MKCKLNLFIIIIFLAILSEVSVATDCSQVFPGGLSSNSPGGFITFNGCSYVQGNPSTTLVTPSFVSHGSGCPFPSCFTAACTASGGTSAQLSLGPFLVASGGSSIMVNPGASTTIDNHNNQTTSYNSVTLSGSSTLNFSANPNGSTLYKINTLTLNGNSNVINFVPGDYWIQNFNCNGSATFTISGTGTVRLYFQGISTSGVQNWNTNGDPSQLLIISYGGMTFNDTTNINGILYANNSVIFNASGTINGAINAANITFNGPAHVQFNSSAVNNLNSGSLCSSNSIASQFSVSAPQTGTNCQNMAITVTAQSTSGQTITNYTGAITLNTQSGSGTWVSTSGGGSFSGGTNNGIATYQFVSSDHGVVTFQLNYPANGPAPITIKAYQTNNTSISGLSGAINFIPAGFLVTDTAVSNPPAAPPPAFSTSQIAGNNFTLYLTAYNSSNCGIVTSYTGTKTIRFWTTYVNPTSGSINATINGTAIANSVAATQTTKSITFTNGVATVTGNYNDVGQLTLNVKDMVSDGPSGASGNFVVKPAQFAINIPNNNAGQVTSPPATAQSACLADPIFAKAGNSFTVNVQPQTSQGMVTPNYGNETAAQGILLTSSALVAPTSGRNGSNNNGAIGNGSTFTKVTSSAGPFAQAPYFTGSTFSFDEVGCINLTASVLSGNYLGAGNVSNSVVVGRFTPDHFDAAGNVPLLTTGCSTGAGSFTYLDQPFLYGTSPVLTLTARALGGTTTQNYKGSFWRLANTALGNTYNKQYYSVNGTDVIPSLVFSAVNAAPAFVDGGNGVGTFTFSDGGGFKIQRQNGVFISPFTAEIQLRIATIIDSDGVFCTNGCNAKAFNFGATTAGAGIGFTGIGGGKQFYHGRMVLIDTIGSELLTLIMPMQTQYYTSGGNGFTLNTLDSCTTFQGGVSSLILTPSSGITTTPSLSSNTFQQGNINISLTAPNASGYVDIEANLTSNGANLPGLQFNWPYAGSTDGAFTADPRGRGTFGIFRGNDRIIYSKEIFD